MSKDSMYSSKLHLMISFSGKRAHTSPLGLLRTTVTLYVIYGLSELLPMLIFCVGIPRRCRLPHPSVTRCRSQGSRVISRLCLLP